MWSRTARAFSSIGILFRLKIAEARIASPSSLIPESRENVHKKLHNQPVRAGRLVVGCSLGMGEVGGSNPPRSTISVAFCALMMVARRSCSGARTFG